MCIENVIFVPKVTNYTYHPANRVSDITVSVIELFVFGMFCQSMLILFLTNAFKQSLTTNVLVEFLCSDYCSSSIDGIYCILLVLQCKWPCGPFVK